MRKSCLYRELYFTQFDPNQAGVKRSDDVSQGHGFSLSISHYRGFKVRDPLMIDRAGHTSTEELLKVLKGEEGP